MLIYNQYKLSNKKAFLLVYLKKDTIFAISNLNIMKLKQQYAQKLESLEDLDAKKIIETALLKKYWIELNIGEACKMCNFLQEKQMTFINLLELIDE